MTKEEEAVLRLARRYARWAMAPASDGPRGETYQMFKRAELRLAAAACRLLKADRKANGNG